MNTQLYPLRFKPIYKTKVWGGHKFRDILNRTDAPTQYCGESWEISSVPNNLSMVTNGTLKGNSLSELIEVYMDELVGEEVYKTFGTTFPLLIKFLDIMDLLSVQVHPDDETAQFRHQSYGKNELWHIVDAEPDAKILIGFNKNIDRDIFIEYATTGRLDEILNIETVKQGEWYFIPAGRIHAATRGLFVLEIQQTSDITYRIFDWNRTDIDGNSRELHIDLALDVLDYNAYNSYKTIPEKIDEISKRILSNKYFTIQTISTKTTITRDYSKLDSFVVYICLEGEGDILWNNNNKEHVKKGDTLLIPACIDYISIQPTNFIHLIEVYI
ncbi:MAG: type I phosphomannose isomerase catalytic subunit [Bacteroidales bacterium]